MGGDLSCRRVVFKEDVLLRKRLIEYPTADAVSHQPEVSSWVLVVNIVVVGSKRVHSENSDIS